MKQHSLRPRSDFTNFPKVDLTVTMKRKKAPPKPKGGSKKRY